MRAEIVTIGTELLLGQIVDTNAAWLAQRLAAEGVNLYRKVTIGDNLERAAGAIREALERSEVVLTTGGLGPTVDDITREAIAAATGRPLRRDPALVERIEAIFERFGRRAGENNRRQADLPEGARPLDNPLGTAPGLLLELPDGGLVIAMPGVPREMKRMFDHEVLPALRERGLSAIIKVRLLRTAAVGESVIDEKIADLERLENPTVGLAAHTGQVDVRVTARAATEKEADVLIDHVAGQIRRRLGDAIFGEDDETLEGVVAEMLDARGARLAIIESRTAGAIAEGLRGAEAPLAATRVEAPGPLPEREAAIARLESVVASCDAAWGLALFATDGDATYGENPGETMIVVHTPEGPRTRLFPQSGADEVSREWIRARALDLLRRALLEIET